MWRCLSGNVFVCMWGRGAVGEGWRRLCVCVFVCVCVCVVVFVFAHMCVCISDVFLYPLVHMYAYVCVWEGEGREGGS